MNSTTLVERIKNGDLKAFQNLYELYFRKALSTALLLVKDQAWAEDIVQDVFTIVWDKREKLIVEMDIWYYIFVLTRNNSISKLRAVQKDQKLKKQLYISLNAQKSYQEDYRSEVEIALKIDLAKSILSPQQRLVYDLCKEEGLSYQQVADRLSISKNTVKNHMVSSYKLLRQYVERDIIYLIILFLK